MPSRQDRRRREGATETEGTFVHISLRQNSTIKSHDGEKRGHFCHCDGKGIKLQLTRGVPLVGQSSLYLLNDFNSLCIEFTKGIIVLPVGQI